MDNLTTAQLLQAVQRMTEINTRKALEIYLASGACKTADAYERSAWRIVREFYGAGIDEFQFVDDFSALIDGQYGRAFRAGARDVGILPNQFQEKDYNELARLIEAEQGNMLQLADDIIKAKADKTGVEQFKVRAQMYANRYDQIVSYARSWFSPDDLMMIWNLGPTETHCETKDGKVGCSQLSGVVASAKTWRDRGLYPGCGLTDCGGWHCGCSLTATDQPPTPGGIPEA